MAISVAAGSRVGSRDVRPATRRVARRLHGAALLAALVACATCTHGDITVVEPAAKGPNDTLALTIVPDGEDAAAASALGWKGGIPGAEVIVAPSVKPNPNGAGDTATGPPIDTLVTDSAGHLSVPNLPAGYYYVEVRRWLTTEERARLSPGEDLIGFATQQVVERGIATLAVPGSHRHSIVLSEWSEFPEYVPGACCYSYGGYLELENNSDTTVYLDGLVIGLFGPDVQSQDQTACARYAPYDDDSDGLWVSYMDSLPGTGHEYPLAPGSSAVIATDAIDHRANSLQDGLDLSHANFEFVGTDDADNPSVPNTVVIGPNGPYGGHGLVLDMGIGAGVVVALPVDPSSLPKLQKYGGGDEWVQRIPRSRILDAFLIWWPNLVTALNDLCPVQVSTAFDRRPAPLMVNTGPDGTWRTLGQYSIQRRVAYARTDGRKILQDTHSAEADFFVGLRTPFQLPQPASAARKAPPKRIDSSGALPARRAGNVSALERSGFLPRYVGRGAGAR